MKTLSSFSPREGSRVLEIDWSYSFVEENSLPVRASYTGCAQLDSEFVFYVVVAFCDDGGLNLICAEDAGLKKVWDFVHVPVNNTPEEETLSWATAWAAQSARRHFDVEEFKTARSVQQLTPY